MNKKNFPIFLSVWITSMFFTMICYFVYTGVQDNYRGIRQESFADAKLDVHLLHSDLEKIKGIEGIKTVGGVLEQRGSALLNDSMLIVNFQDRGINEMREYSDLLEGRFAEDQHEIVLSKDLIERYQLALGESISLSAGKRLLDRQEVHPASTYTEKETFKVESQPVYEIVGVYKNVYNKYLNVSFALSIPREDAKLRPYLRFDDFKKAYAKKEILEEEIEKRLGTPVTLEFSEGLIHYYGVKDSGMRAHVPMIVNGGSIFSTILLFIFFIRNVFRVWGFKKIRELSMYRSIGTTNFQIYGILSKEAILISILPILIGHGTGYFLMDQIYRKAQEIKMADQIVPMEFSFLSSMTAVTVALIIVTAAVLSPLQAISKINIIDGIRGNFYSKNRKRKRNENLWKELRDNNMDSIKSLRYITAVGTIIISCFLMMVGISSYYYELQFFKSSYNVNVIYSSTLQDMPKAFEEILDHLPHKRAYISRGKYFNVDYDVPFSKEAKEIGVANWLQEEMEGKEEKRIHGMLIGLEEKELNKLGGKKGEFLLRNIVQEDPRVPLSKARYIPYLNDPSMLTIYLSGAKPGRQIKITKTIESIGAIEELLRPMEIHIFTDLETQRSLIEGHEKAQEARANFELKMEIEDPELGSAKEYIENTLKDGASLDYRFTIVTGDEVSADRSVDLKAFLLVVGGIGLVILLLNMTNGYASINMSILSRKREIGSLYSCGMEKKELLRLYLTEFFVEEGRSVGVTIGVSAFVMLAISLLSKSISLKTLLIYYPWLLFVIFSILIYGANMLLYYFALNNILKQPIVDLIRGE